MKPRYEFIFPEATPSNNQVMRWHLWNRKKENDRVHWIMRQIIGPISKRETLELCELHITRHGARQLDYDNLAGGFKFLIDSLVNNRVILDDRPACIVEKRFEQVKCKRAEQQTIIQIYDRGRI